MPQEKRDPMSGAKLFIPTTFEKSLIQQRHELKNSLAEVEAMKAELKSILEQAKKTL